MKAIKIGKSQFGFYIQFEDKSFKGTTEAVNKFLNGKLPAEVEIEATEGTGKEEIISRIKVQGSQRSEGHQTPYNSKELVDGPVTRLRREIDWKIASLNAVTQLVVAGKVNLKEMGMYYGHIKNFDQMVVKPANDGHDQQLEVRTEKVLSTPQ